MEHFIWCYHVDIWNEISIFLFHIYMYTSFFSVCWQGKLVLEGE